MSELQIVLMMTGIVLGIRLAGLYSSQIAIPETWERALRFAPVAVLAALTGSTLISQASGDLIRLVAAAGAAGVMLLTRRLWLCLASGFTFYWILRIITG